MSKLKKHMCKLSSDGLKKKHEAEIIAEVLHPKYICKYCLHVATDKKLLCNPKKLR